MDKIQTLKDALLKYNPILFLGAGFSYGSKNILGDIPTGKKLNEEIFEKFILNHVNKDELEEIKLYDLEDTCQFVDTYLGQKKELRTFLVDRLKNVEPRDFHMFLPCYPWKKIYTVNIDDLVENIYAKAKKDIIVQNREKQKDSSDKLEYIKLHGCVNAPDEKFVFSKTEYTNLISSKINFKLNNLVQDIQKEYFIFIGANLDESDIDYYITQYENAGYFRRGKLFFIDPSPSMKLKARIKALKGIIIEWTTEDFLKFIKRLDYNPGELQMLKNRLNYSGLFLYEDIIKSLPKDSIYESKLYEGYNSNWQDVINGWLFESPSLEKIQRNIENLTFENYDCFCLSLYGRSYTGKDCLLKQIGYYLDEKGFDVLEYKGKFLNIKLLKEYINKKESKRFALLIENASFYYKNLEKLLQTNFDKKQLLIITTSRNYYHMKKRYYLEGNAFDEYLVDDKIDPKFAEIIYNKLAEKGYLGNLPSAKTKSIPQILRKGNLINLFTDLTYGEGFRKSVSKTVNKILESGEQIQNLYIELAVFDKADLSYYPYELLTERYTIDFNIFKNQKTEMITEDQKFIVDYVRIDENGISLKNSIMVDKIWNKLDDVRKKISIVNILKSISRYVVEKEDNYWRIIFESLLKEDRMEKRFNFNINQILNIYYELKGEFNQISYYWLQLGIAEQRNKDFSKALNHLKMAQKIRPKAYQIQHAIARNYLKHANYIQDSAIAITLFEEGEQHMRKLINSQDNYKSKARNFSVHCYVCEKIIFIKKHTVDITNDMLLEMKRYIDMIINDQDAYINGLVSSYVNLLKKLNKLDILHMRPGDKYFEALGKEEDIDIEYDKLIDSY